jgi:hypothetical protein
LQTVLAAGGFIRADHRSDRTTCDRTRCRSAPAPRCRTQRKTQSAAHNSCTNSIVVDRLLAAGNRAGGVLTALILIALENVERLVGRRVHRHGRPERPGGTARQQDHSRSRCK